MRWFGLGSEASHVACLCRTCGIRYVLGVNAAAVLQPNFPDRIGLVGGRPSWPAGVAPPPPARNYVIPPEILDARKAPTYRHWMCHTCGTTQPYPWCGGLDPNQEAPAPPPPQTAPESPSRTDLTQAMDVPVAAQRETGPMAAALPSPDEARATLFSLGATTEDQILRALNDPDDSLSAAAATTLGELGNQHVVGRLIDLLNRPTIRRRPSMGADAACIALGKLGGNRAVTELIALTQIPQRAGPALEGLEIALMRHAQVLESPMLSKLVGIPGIRYQRPGADGQIETVQLDKTHLRELAQSELRRRAGSR
jgi:hypothetical protein